MGDMCSSTRQDRKGVTAGVARLCPPHHSRRLTILRMKSLFASKDNMGIVARE